jgi:hypothetical protein
MKPEEYKAFLTALKPGDTIDYIVTTGRYGLGTPARITIVRRTPKQIVCKISGYHIETRFYAETGRKVGGSCFEKMPTPASKDAIKAASAEVRRRRNARTLREHDWSKEPADVIEAAIALIKSINEAKEQQA